MMNPSAYNRGLPFSQGSTSYPTAPAPQPIGGGSTAYNSSRDAAEDAIDEYHTAYEAAKESNLERYNRLLDMADQLSSQRTSDVRRSFRKKNAKTQQKLASLGMGNTTVAPTMVKGYERAKQAELNRTSDVGTRRKMGIVERRTDSYPSPQVVLGLLRNYGRYANAR